MYKKYILKRGKRIGPYYYTSKRINGKVRTIYLGSDPSKFMKPKAESGAVKPKIKQNVLETQPKFNITPEIKETVIGVDKGEFSREISKLQEGLNFEKRGSSFNKSPLI